jgi:hypothetical protein
MPTKRARYQQHRASGGVSRGPRIVLREYRNAAERHEADPCLRVRMKSSRETHERVDVGAGLDDDDKTCRGVEAVQQRAQQQEGVRDRSSRRRHLQPEGPDPNSRTGRRQPEVACARLKRGPRTAPPFRKALQKVHGHAQDLEIPGLPANRAGQLGGDFDEVARAERVLHRPALLGQKGGVIRQFAERWRTEAGGLAPRARQC